jgi:hypothetical protein
MEWQPIRRTGPPEVRDIDERGDRVQLALRISDDPPREWATYLENMFRGEPYQYTVRGAYVLVWARRDPKSVTAWAANVDRDVEAADEYYLSVLADRERQRGAQAEAEVQRQQKMDEARGWIEAMKPPEATP